MLKFKRDYLVASLCGVAIGALAPRPASRHPAPESDRVEFAAARQRQAADERIRQQQADDLKTLSRDCELLDAVLPENSAVDPVVKQVCQLASDNALKVIRIAPLPGKQTAQMSDQPIAIDVSGNFNSFYGFLLQIESLPRLNHVSQMKLTQVNATPGDVEATLELDVFSAVPAPGQATAGAQ